MLTDEQLAIRATGIGASEVSQILDEDPWHSPIELWLSKPTPSRGPLLPPRDETDRTILGSLLEDGIRAFYAQATGIEMRKVGETFRHPTVERALASPDGLPVDPAIDRGLEIKLVGANVAHHWAGDTIPDYVAWQMRQNMAVCGKGSWDVCAILGGTTPVIRTLVRDLELEELMLENVASWWAAYVDNDVEPPALSAADRRLYLAARYPSAEATQELIATEDEDVVLLATWLREAKALGKSLEEAEKVLENLLIERVGSAYGIEGSWGKFLWYPRRGNPKWAEVAAELAGGAVPQAIVDRHRGQDLRVPALYAPKKSAAKPRRKKG